tara:strand:+ start:13297 stop:13665 length:369 start_codon:yes stop_codon:yes gene_type:complete
MPVLRLLGSQWKLLAGVALFVVIGFLWLRLQVVNARLDASQSYVLELEATNTQNTLEIDRYKQQQLRNAIAVQVEQARRKGIDAELTELRSRIDDAPQNGCVGPAVHAVIDGLRTPADRQED